MSRGWVIAAWVALAVSAVLGGYELPRFFSRYEAEQTARLVKEREQNAPAKEAQRLLAWKAVRDEERRRITDCEKLCAPHAFEYGSFALHALRQCHCMTAVRP